jgi:RNA polymerase sigma factor for flagellar operon FliA
MMNARKLEQTRPLATPTQTNTETPRAPAPVIDLDQARLRRRTMEFAPLIDRIVGKWMSRVGFAFTADDLRSAAWLGLIEAVRRYDSRRGIPFEAFAHHRITGAVLDEIRSHDKLTRPSRRRARALDTVREKLTRRLNREPTDVEVADAAGEAIDTFHKRSARQQAQAVVHLEDLGTDDWQRLVSDDSPSALDGLCEQEQSESLAAAMATLPERVRRILDLYYREEMSYREIGQLLGVTESRICQLVKSAHAQLRAQLDPCG